MRTRCHLPDDRLAFQRRFEATPEAVRVALGDLCDALSPLSLSTDETATIELVLAEVLNNIVEHAYRGLAEGPIEIAVTALEDGLAVCLSDWGIPMPGGHLPDGAFPDPCASPAGAAEGGYGWFLIRTLTRDLAYSRLGGRNVLGFRLDIVRAGAAV